MGIPPSLSLFTVSVSVSAAAMVIAAGIYSFYSYKSRRRQSIRPQRSSDSTKAYLQLIGNTPLCQLHVLSGILGRKVFVKMESMNPGGTGKDRAAKYMLQMACQHDVRHATKEMFEGTSGSTGIALAYLCNAMGLKLNVVMPDDQAEEKRILLERLGVTVTIVPPCGISNAHHYVNTARRMAKEADGIFLDQFENLANFRAHYEVTGPELWEQTKGTLDAFVMSAGTGGTIAGVSRYLKSKKSTIKVVLADPTGSSLFNKVVHGVCYTPQQSEKTVKKHRYDSIVEGVGLDRVTANFDEALIDEAECVSDQEICDMAHWLLQQEGLFVGSSSAMNVVAACRVAKRLPVDSVIVTVICDSGQRHLSRFWNPEYIEKYGIRWPQSDVVPSVLL